MLRFSGWWLPAFLAIAVGSGCRSARRDSTTVHPLPPPGSCPPAKTAAVYPGAPPGQPIVSPAPPAPVQPGIAFPSPGGQPPAAPAPLPPGNAFPPGQPPPPGQQPPPPAFPGTSNFPPDFGQKVEYRWQPAPNAVRLAPPEPIGADSVKEKTKLYPPPEITETPSPSKAPPPALPVGIPQFSMVKDQVSCGLRPSLDDGLDWLQANNYRTVLFVRKIGEDDSADRKQVEKRGMIFLSLEMPADLSKKIVDDFIRIVGDKAGQPLFVYDRDGSLAGGMWYLYFRSSEQVSDEVARIRAGSLGFRENREEPHRAMWQAIQKYLESSRQ